MPPGFIFCAGRINSLAPLNPSRRDMYGGVTSLAGEEPELAQQFDAAPCFGAIHKTSSVHRQA